eukprot:s1579_g27.t1
MAHQTHPDQVQFLAELQHFQDGMWLREHASNTLIMLDDLTDKLEEIGQQHTGNVDVEKLFHWRQLR